MRFRVLDAATDEGREAWLALWRASPMREPMAHPDFARLFARPVDRVVCATGEGDGRTILLALVLRPLAAEPWATPGEQRWDATTPYGYGGPLAWGPAGGDDAFWRAHAEWCAEERIASSFMRLSLFADDLAALPPVARVEPRLENVVVPLAGGEDALWRGYDTKVRRWVRAARAAGVEVEVDRDCTRVDAFHAIYTRTMERRGAADWYFFPRSLFDAIAECLAGSAVIFHARLGGEIVSSDLVLRAADHAYYFLGGSLEAAFDAGANYLLKHRAACWLESEGLRAFVLGGGYEPGDTLFRYKRAYARHGVVPFRTASLVHDEGACRALCDDRAAAAVRAGAAWSPRTGYFPPYRG